MRFSKLPKSFLARKVIFLSLLHRLLVVFPAKQLNVFLDLGKHIMFLLSKLPKIEFLVMNLVLVKYFFGSAIFSGI